ncbi:helix-turn-helix domain-containing protein [Massilia sp. S19_KUP03_FR1]|uniref:helix-turn-helix domain-containing protein n=1 Tax=Massilia sp. S19_KUP03_FR1 TaxID=3025503 RepID=UPI002FCD7AD2
MKESITSEVLPNTTGNLLIQGTFRAFAFPRHMHEGYSIGLVQRGVNRFACAGTRWAARPGQLCVMNPAQVHSSEADAQGWTYTNLFLEPDALCTALGRQTRSSPIVFRQHVIDDACAVSHFTALANASTAGTDAMAGECAHALLLARLGRLASGVASDSSASASAIARVRDLLDTVCERSVTLAELARVADMDTFHLVRSFSAMVGMAPYAYHLNRRLQCAQRMIAAGSLLADTAFATGFTDQAHFTRHFRRFLGLTPGRLARSVRQRQAVVRR